MLVVGGPSRTNRNRTGTGTSSTDSSSTASCSRTNAMVGCFRKSTLPGRHQDTTDNMQSELHTMKDEETSDFKLFTCVLSSSLSLNGVFYYLWGISSSPTRTTVASAFTGIFSSSFSSCLDFDRCIPLVKVDSFCWKQNTGRGNQDQNNGYLWFRYLANT